MTKSGHFPFLMKCMHHAVLGWNSSDANVCCESLLHFLSTNSSLTLMHVLQACAEVVGLSSSVMLNLILTLQRFISIVISACIFNAPPYPPLMMWLGAALVIAGCINYVIVPKEKQ